ncbi:MAG TPA: AMP-binding protein [Pseudomonadales bacterium]
MTEKGSSKLHASGSAGAAAGSESELAARLLETVRALAVELEPERARLQVTLDTPLDRTLGFDSLSRVELLLRLERGLNVQLAEQAFNAAETPRDLLHAALASASAAKPPATLDIQPLVLGATDAVPPEVDTLQGVLAWRAERHPDRTHVLLYEAGSEQPSPITYAGLQQAAQRLAAGLVAAGLEPGGAVAIMLPTSRAYLETFFGVLLAGGVPVPIYPPARPSQLEDHLRRHARILDNAAAAMLVTVAEARAVARLLRRQAPKLKSVLTPDELRSRGGEYVAPRVAADDTAFVQYTSGSTGQPKGVILSHANLIANIRAMGERVRAGPDDVFVSWLPLYHDMGLIGAWLGSLYFAMLSVLMPPTTFLTRPTRWLKAIDQHQATITAAPNFAWELCLTKIPDEAVEKLDLSSLRLAFNGAEPVSPSTLRRFQARFGRHGLDPAAIAPVYGLAEVAVGLTFPPLGRGPLIDRVQREPFERGGRAVPVAADDEDVLEFVACGQPLRGYEVRIADDAGRELADREIGHLQFRGPSATRGYLANPEATAQLFRGDWLDSGDLAYVAGGDVYLTSRVKDVIIRAGRNLYPYELEEAAGSLDGVRKGCVAVFGSTDAAANAERLIVVAETRLTEPVRLADLKRRIEMLGSELLGVTPDDVVLVPPRTVLKTSSGKIRRAACRSLYERGRLGRGPRAGWWQVARVWLAGLLPQWRRARKSGADLAYAGYAYCCFGLMLPVALAALCLFAGSEGRWRALGGLARTLLRMCRVPVVINGVANLPADGACVVVANHASYLDGLLLMAALPRPVSFIAKAELREQAFPRWFLGRIGAEFVERFDVSQGTADARRLSARAAGGSPLLFFPEGTFTRSPGLLAFRMGAFLVAADNGLPVIPITLRGTRSVLRSDDWFPRRGAVAVVVGEALAAPSAGSNWDTAVALRAAARAEILRHVGEQDLALERGLAE